LSLPQNLKSDLEFSSEPLNILRKVSNEVTEFTRKVCWELNLDRDVRVIVSLRRFTEPEWEGVKVSEDVVKKFVKVKEIYGYYDPQRKTIVLSIPCARDEETFSLTLAHELIHHCQFTCRSKACSDICEYWLSPEEAHEIREMLPYEERPYEVEAYSKDEALANRIKSIAGLKEIVNRIREAYAEILLIT
jgi:hypothetical protein